MSDINYTSQSSQMSHISPLWSTQRPKPLPKPSRLLALPLELQNSIITHLSVPSALSLKLTNRHFNTLINPTHTELLATEKTWWARSRNLYTCMDCCHLLKPHHFADAMKKGAKGLNGKEPHKRFCIDCGLHPKAGTTRYSPGAEITVGGERHVVCKWCRKYTNDVACVGSAVCKVCHERQGCKCPPKKVAAPRSNYLGRRWARRRSSSFDFDDDLPDCYDEHFWETYDPSD